MIKQLPAVDEPEWLLHIDSKSMAEAPFPLAAILRGSLYYPSSGFDGDPIRYLAGNFTSFIYCDYGLGHDDLRAALIAPGFHGYKILASRDVTEEELTCRGWIPSFTLPQDGDPVRFRDRMKTPFCLWTVLQRCDEVPVSHGPYRFSLLYLCADGVAAFQALYVANNASPRVVAIIQPGHGFGWNWTNYEDPHQIFARTVLQNPAGRPAVLLYGGIGQRGFYRQPCWPDYPKLVRFLDKAGGGSIGVWSAPNR